MIAISDVVPQKSGLSALFFAVSGGQRRNFVYTDIFIFISNKTRRFFFYGYVLGKTLKIIAVNVIFKLGGTAVQNGTGTNQKKREQN